MSKVQEQWDGLLFGVRRSVRYHNRRRRFFETWHRVTSGAAVLFGSAAMASLLTNTENTDLAIWAAGLVTLLASIDLVVGTARASWNHAELARRFIDLEKVMVATTASKSSYQECNNARLDIEADEPPALRVLNILCHNEQAKAEGYGDEAFYLVAGYQRLAAHFMDINDASIALKSATQTK